jgi:chromosome segregation ATPase
MITEIRVASAISTFADFAFDFLNQAVERAPGQKKRLLERRLVAAQRRALALQRNIDAMLAKGLDGKLIEDYRNHIAGLEAKLIEAEEELVCKDLDIARLEREGPSQAAPQQSAALAAAFSAPTEALVEIARLNAALEGRLKGIQAELKVERARSVRLARTVVDLRTRVSPEAEADHALRERVEALSGANVDLQAEAGRAARASKRVLDLHKVVRALTARFREYVARFKAAEEVTVQREQEIVRLSEMVVRLRGQLDEVLSAGSPVELEREVARLRTQLDEARQEVDLAAETASSEVAERLARELRHVILERDDLSHRFNETQNALTDQKRISGALEKKLRDLADRLKTYEELAVESGRGDLKLKSGAPVAMPMEQTGPLVIEFSRIKAERDELVQEHAESAAQLERLRGQIGQIKTEKESRDQEILRLHQSLDVAHGEVLVKGRILDDLRGELDASRFHYETLRSELKETRGLIQGADTKKQQVLQELINKIEQEADMKLSLRMAEQEAKRSHERVEELEKKLTLLAEVADKKVLGERIARKRAGSA